MKNPVYTTEITTQHKSIVRMLLYFDIFEYPLNKQELTLAVDENNEVEDALNELIAMGVLHQENEWYFLKGKKYSKRISTTSASPHFFKKAKKYAALIYQFPFVQGVYISGSLSKGWADDTTDVDYFIVTSPNRLWVSRTLLILFKKVFLLNSRKYFCLNYFIDTENLEIEEKNIFTATEVCFLKPIVNDVLYQEFMQSNHWVKKYYAQKPPFDPIHLIEKKEGVFKKLGEKLLKGKLGENMDIWAMKRTLKFWKNKFPEIQSNDFEINFKSGRSISKHHPSGFQKRVVETLDAKIKEFEMTTQISLK
jgi:hypothetical protein